MEDPSIHAFTTGAKDAVDAALRSAAAHDGGTPLGARTKPTGRKSRQRTWQQIAAEAEAGAKCEASLNEALDTLLRIRRGSAALFDELERVAHPSIVSPVGGANAAPQPPDRQANATGKHPD